MVKAVSLLGLMLLASGCVRYLDPKRTEGGVDLPPGIDARVDAGNTDGSKDTGPDLLPTPDVLAPDQLVVPDAGCPAGLTQCGGVCADTKADIKHCGGCNKPCDKRSDKCINGACVCGANNGACPAGVNCVKGACLCLESGLCAGCCADNMCIPVASQDAKHCGLAGTTCKACASLVCSDPTCLLGVCGSKVEPDGTPCDDGLVCTNPDTCKKGGCHGTLLGGYCQIGTKCYPDGTYKSTTPQCHKCVVKSNTSGWTHVANPGCVTTFAGTGYAGHLNGDVHKAKFYKPSSVAVDGTGAVWVADSGNHCIRRIANGVVTSFGTGSSGYMDGPAGSAMFNDPRGVATTVLGGIVVADTGNHRIRGIDQLGTVTTLAGNGAAGLFNSVDKLKAMFKEPAGVTEGAAGTIYVADRANHVIRTITSAGVTTLAGSGSLGSTDGTAAAAQFANPFDVAYDKSSTTLFVADKLNSRVRSIPLGTKLVATFAGSSDGFGDGPAVAAQFKFVYGIDVAPGANGAVVVVADGGNNRIRWIEGGVVKTLAGDGGTGLTNGPATSAEFATPNDVAVGPSGEIYIADHYNHCIRLYTP